MVALGFEETLYGNFSGHEMMISKDQATLFYDVIQEARIDERKNVALDNYQDQTFSDSTNWKGKFQKFIDNNERRLKHLKQSAESDG